ncbi:hypothetical protein [Flavobacterium sp. UBA6135]|uniref:hypothetical protein n=1 Tax=Flavobacterium sp. UBA6135 TaxID=1946553 RepID=UPI0025C0688F|nr:hypothetical protein [Flavobacterium sp. UBA6135]
MKHLFLTLLLITSYGFSQNISSENIDFLILKQPKENIDVANRLLKVTVTSPYNVTADDVIKKSKADHQAALDNYSTVLANSEKEFKQKLVDHDEEVVKAKEKFEMESAEFKKLSMLERLTMTEQGKNPKLVNPIKPVYVKPTPPVYREPNLNDHIIVNNSVLSSQINVEGFTKDGSYLDVAVNISEVQFQDNAGQTFANQPTTLVVKVNGVEKINTKFFEEFKFISSSPSNNINKALEEKNHLNKVVAFLNQYLNDNFGFQSMKKTIKLEKVKNKGEYDDLEKAHVFVTTNLKKLQPSEPERTAAAVTAMQKGIDIWLDTLTKVDFKKDSKSVLNAKIGRYIYFNLIRLNLGMNRKADAEKYLNEFQENYIGLKLSYDEQNELKALESEIYKK